MTKRNILISIASLFVLAALLYQVPAINSRLAWRIEVAKTYAKNIINPVGDVPTAIPNPTGTKNPVTPTITPTTVVVETPIPATPTLPPLPAQALLTSPAYEKQTPNNCGPAALSMMLHIFGWSGTQKDISDVIKPVVGDRNVNPEEMAYWVGLAWLFLRWARGDFAWKSSTSHTDLP